MRILAARVAAIAALIGLAHVTYAQDHMSPEDARQMELDLIRSALSLAKHHLWIYEYNGGEPDPVAADNGRGHLRRALQYYNLLDDMRLPDEDPNLVRSHHDRGVIYLYLHQHTGNWEHVEKAKTHFRTAETKRDIRSKIELHRLPERPTDQALILTRDEIYCDEISQLYSLPDEDAKSRGIDIEERALIAEEYGRLLYSPICGFDEGYEVAALMALEKAAEGGRTFAQYLLYQHYKSECLRMNGREELPCQDVDHIVDSREFPKWLMNAALAYPDPYAIYGLFGLGDEFYRMSKVCKASTAPRGNAGSYSTWARTYENKAVVPLLVAGNRSTFRFVPFCLRDRLNHDAFVCVSSFLGKRSYDPISNAARLLSRLLPNEESFWIKRANDHYTRRADDTPLGLEGGGTGFLVGNSAVLTNEHVVDDCDEIRVDASRVSEDHLWYSAEDGLDLALMEMDKPRQGVVVRPFGLPRPGSEVFVYGYDQGFGHPVRGSVLMQPRFSRGVVGGWEFLEEGSGFEGGNYIRHTAPNYSGNSGGPLIDNAGRVVGVTTGGLSGSENYGFAISSHKVVEFLKSKGLVSVLLPKADHLSADEMGSDEVVDIASELVVAVTCWK